MQPQFSQYGAILSLRRRISCHAAAEDENCFVLSALPYRILIRNTHPSPFNSYLPGERNNNKRPTDANSHFVFLLLSIEKGTRNYVAGDGWLIMMMTRLEPGKDPTGFSLTNESYNVTNVVMFACNNNEIVKNFDCGSSTRIVFRPQTM